MNKADLLHIFIFSIPEALVIACLAVILVGAKFKLQEILIMGVFIGFLSHFWRLLLSNYILNIVVYIVILVIFMTFFKLGSDLFARTISVIMTISIYLGTEFINLKVFDIFFGLDPATMFAEPLVRYACFGGQILIIFLLSYLLRYFKFALFDRGYHEEI